jgi:hypothetical protein
LYIFYSYLHHGVFVLSLSDPTELRASSLAAPKCLLKCRRRVIWARGRNRGHTRGPRRLPVRPEANKWVVASGTGPFTAGSSQECRQPAVASNWLGGSTYFMTVGGSPITMNGRWFPRHRRARWPRGDAMPPTPLLQCSEHAASLYKTAPSPSPTALAPLPSVKFAVKLSESYKVSMKWPFWIFFAKCGATVLGAGGVRARPQYWGKAYRCS